MSQIRSRSRYIFLGLNLILYNLFPGIETLLRAQDNTLYLMHTVPQANHLNPAVINRCRTYIELPVLSSFKLQLRNTGFGYHDAIIQGSGPSEGLFVINWNQLEKKLSRINYFKTDLDINFLGFGLAIHDWYFTFNISNHTEIRLGYPRDLISIKDGNWDFNNSGSPNNLKFNGLGIDATNWNSISLSAAKEIQPSLFAGLRFKYLMGTANINTSRSKFILRTSEDPIALEAEAKYRLNASFPVQLGYNSFGLVNSVDASNAFSNPIQDYILNKNRGIAFDAGIVYDYDESTQITASIVDMGFIWWRSNVNNFSADGSYTFQGIDLDQYQQDPGNLDFFQALEDSLMQSFSADGSQKGYLGFTSLKIFGGITREILPKLKAGAMTRTEVYDLRIRPSVSVNLQYLPRKSVAAILSYNIMNNKFDQFGAGIALGHKGTQFYLVTDNIPVRITRDASSGLLWPYNARMLSIRFGLNILFHCKEKKKSLRFKSTKICPAYWD